MKFLTAILIGLVATTGAKHIIKRGSSYGDEMITPPPYAPEPTTYGAPGLSPVEQNIVEAKQEYAPASETRIEQSGYRKKKSSGYGDELITPPPATAAPYGGEEIPPTSAPEYVPVTERNDYNAGYAPSPQPSGY
uniref:Secreted protein n=1 Tax=Strongyloides papillosus TaxID=174720 RepID=A0A0N5BQF8_STREA